MNHIGKRKALRLIFIGLLLGSLSSCYQITFQSAHLSPIQINRTRRVEPPLTVIRHLYYEVPIDYILGTHPQQNSQLEALIQSQLTTNEGLINLKITQSPKTLDLVVTALTLGIYSRSTLIIEGDIIRRETP